MVALTHTGGSSALHEATMAGVSTHSAMRWAAGEKQTQKRKEHSSQARTKRVRREKGRGESESEKLRWGRQVLMCGMPWPVRETQ